jgi:hypothetical protein
MRPILDSLHRDHRDIEEVLCILDRECDLFQRVLGTRRYFLDKDLWSTGQR